MAIKRRPGPRRKLPGERKDRVIGIRVTEAEYERFEHLAATQHVPLAAWARAQILRALEFDSARERDHRESVVSRQEQDEKLAATRELLNETIRLCQSAVPRRPRDESNDGKD